MKNKLKVKEKLGVNEIDKKMRDLQEKKWTKTIAE